MATDLHVLFLYACIPKVKIKEEEAMEEGKRKFHGEKQYKNFYKIQFNFYILFTRPKISARSYLSVLLGGRISSN